VRILEARRIPGEGAAGPGRILRRAGDRIPGERVAGRIRRKAEGRIPGEAGAVSGQGRRP